MLGQVEILTRQNCQWWKSISPTRQNCQWFGNLISFYQNRITSRVNIGILAIWAVRLGYIIGTEIGIIMSYISELYQYKNSLRNTWSQNKFFMHYLLRNVAIFMSISKFWCHNPQVHIGHFVEIVDSLDCTIPNIFPPW